MCGIAGFTFEHQDGNQSSIQAMTDALSHRGPDAQGTCLGQGIALGHRRLSILDLSDSAAQPMVDKSGRYMMVFNGEIYNYLDVKADLEDYSFTSTGDTEVVLAAYHKWGKDCLQKFNGMFALAIWDKEDQELFLARDRMGIKPIYYHLDKGQLSFASELRSLLASGNVPARLNRDALEEYLQYYSVNSPRTLLDGVFMLKAGHFATWKAGNFQSHEYWSLAEQGAGKEEASYEAICQSSRELLSKSVERRMISDVPLGAFLSGGIDSSAIVALMAQASEQAVHTFSVIFEEKEFDESPYSSMIAQRYRTSHHPIKLSPADFLKELPNALEAMDHPSGDGINSYVVSQATRKEGFTVALSGLGGDELYAGYPVFKQFQKLQSMSPLFAIPTPLRKVGANVVGAVSKGARVARFQQMLSRQDQGFEHQYPLFREIFSPRERKELLLHASVPFSFNSIFSSDQLKKIGRYPIYSQVSVGEMSTYTQNVLLRDTDQMSMAHSLEVRVPFFDHELVEFALRVGDADKEPIFPKKLLVDSLGELLPHEVVHRKKMGFVFPWIEWLKGPLKSFADQKLQQLAKRGIFHPERLNAYWQGFLGGDAAIYWIKIWMLVVLESWMEQNGIEG